jgi:hypothetical protein
MEFELGTLYIWPDIRFAVAVYVCMFTVLVQTKPVMKRIAFRGSVSTSARGKL